LKKAARIAGFSLAALLLVAGLLVLWVLHTESGTRSALALARGWLPAGLTIEAVDGTLGGSLRVRNFRFHDASVGMDLRIESAELEFSVFALLTRRLKVRRVLADGVTLDLFPASSTAPAQVPVARDPWVAPIDMWIDDLRLTRAELRRAQAEPLAIRSAHLSGSWRGANIIARQLEVDSPDGSAALEIRIAERAPRLELLRGKVRWRIGENWWSGMLDAAGGRDQLRFKANLETPVIVDVGGDVAITHHDERISAWRAHLGVSRFDPHPLLDTEAFQTAALEFDASGDTQSAELHGVLSLDEQRVIIERLAAKKQQELLQLTALLRLNAQPAAFTGTATVALDGSRPSSAQLAWDEFRLPDAWMGAHFSTSGKLAATSSGDRFAVNGNARLSRGQRHSALSLRLDGSTDALRIQEFELTQTPGALSVAGDVALGTPARWKLDATARDFDPSLFLEEWPGALNFGLHTTGEWPEAGPRARFQLANLSGRLRGRSIAGAGDVSIGPDRKPSGNLQLQSGGASLTAVASSGPRPRVDATLKIAELQEWRKQLGGAIEAQLTATGRWPEVDLDARLTASRLRSGETQVGSARAHLTSQNVRTRRGALELHAGGVLLGGREFDAVDFKIDGDAARHTIDLEARGEQQSLGLHAAGAYRQSAWSGVIDRLDLRVTPVPSLALTEPTRLVVERNDFEIGLTCLAGGDISLCAGARRDGGELTASYSLKSLPLELLTALAAPQAGLSVEGVLGGEGNLRRTANGALSGRATLLSSAGAFAQAQIDSKGEKKSQDASEDGLRLEYRNFGVDLDLTPTAANAKLRGELLNQGDLTGALSVAMAEEDPGLAGEASVKLRDLAPLGWWMPQLANLRGSGEVAAQVSGTASTPRIAFIVRGTGLDAEVPMLGVHLREGRFDASLEPAGDFKAEGSLHSGDGTVRLGGARNAEKELELRIAGENFQAANIPGARVVIAPDLALAGKIGDLSLTGTVRIDDADVNFEKLSIGRSYHTSDDVVIVDREIEVKERAPGLTTDVRVILGERVKLSGFGLDSTVSGELQVVEGKDQPGRATGEIRLAGTYEAFGRKLNIERGKLMFAGTPLDDPQLDILAVRKLQDVTAKLAITGTAQHPKLDVFTDPAMSQTDAMSYLLTGKPASDVHGEDGAVVQSASQNVGMILGNRLAKRLGGKMSFIDQVGVEQNADLGGSAFTVGKYLSPKLFVSYGVGLFEPGSAVTVRYEFSERWSLEANDTPEDQHAGVRYRIEK